MSPRQRQVLAIVNDAIAATGVSPNSVDLAREIGLSRNQARVHLRALEESGFLLRTGAGRRFRTLEIVRMPGGGLSAAELAWCRANPSRVRAMMAVAGDALPRVAVAVPARVDPSPGPEEALEAGRRALDTMAPGYTAFVTLPSEPTARKRAYHAISELAARRWGSRSVIRTITPMGVCLSRRQAEAPR